MPRGSWLANLRPQAGAEIPAGLRFIGAALSGAALSLSYTGLHLSIYSWVCIGILISSLFGGRPRVALGCGFLHGLLFVLTSVPWIATVLTAHGGLSVAGGWGLLLLIAIAWGILVGGFAWAVHRLSRQSTELACLGAPFIWVTFEFIRAHLPEISFPWNLLGYPAAANLCLVQLTTITGIYGLSFLVAGFNALLSWTMASNTLTLGRRIACGVTATAILLSAALAGPRLAPQAQAHHFARAVQLNFPEVESYPADWFQAHAADLLSAVDQALARSADLPLEESVLALVRAGLDAHRVNPELHKVLVEQVLNRGLLNHLDVSRAIQERIEGELRRRAPGLAVDKVRMTAFVLETCVEALTHRAVVEAPDWLTSGMLEQEATAAGVMDRVHVLEEGVTRVF